MLCLWEKRSIKDLQCILYHMQEDIMCTALAGLWRSDYIPVKQIVLNIRYGLHLTSAISSDISYWACFYLRVHCFYLVRSMKNWTTIIKWSASGLISSHIAEHWGIATNIRQSRLPWAVTYAGSYSVLSVFLLIRNSRKVRYANVKIFLVKISSGVACHMWHILLEQYGFPQYLLRARWETSIQYSAIKVISGLLIGCFKQLNIFNFDFGSKTIVHSLSDSFF